MVIPLHEAFDAQNWMSAFPLVVWNEGEENLLTFQQNCQSAIKTFQEIVWKDCHLIVRTNALWLKELTTHLLASNSDPIPISLWSCGKNSE